VDFFSVFRTIVRRWYVVLLGVVVTAIAAAAVMGQVAPRYEATGSVLLTSPPRSTTGDAGETAQNPFLAFDFSTTIFTGVVVQIMNDAVVREGLHDRGARIDYQIGQSGENAPLIFIVATDPDAEVAMRTVELVQAGISEELDRRQSDAGAPADAQVRSVVITEPSRATELIGGRIRAGLAVGGLGLAASVSLAFFVDGMAEARRRGAAAAPAAETARVPGANGRSVAAVRRVSMRPSPPVEDVTAPQAANDA
jgi:hypothetical protein